MKKLDWIILNINLIGQFLHNDFFSFQPFFLMILFRGQKKSCLKHPKEIVTNLDEENFSQLAIRDLKKAVYPIYLIASDPK